MKVLALPSDKVSPRLLLLFGTPRSGTTWLGKLLDSHPDTLYKHEPDRSGFRVPFAADVEQFDEYRDTIRDFVGRLAVNNSTHTAARLPVFHKQYRSRIADPVHRLSVFASGAASSFGWKFPVLQCANTNSADVRLVWKSTDSLGRLGVILRALDDCRAVRIIRHPCGYIASVLRGEAQRKFVASVPTSEDYGIMQKLIDATRARGRGLTIDHMRQFHPVERLAWIWVLLNEKAEDDTRADPRCTSVRYEDICRDPVRKTQELFAFFGLNWTSQTAAFIRASTLGTRPSGLNRITQDSSRYYGIFREPQKAAEKWQTEMNAEDVARVFRVLRQSDLIRLYPESEPAPVAHRA
jgi:hypothetical protein